MPLDIGYPDHDRRRLRNQAEAFFALAHGIFGEGALDQIRGLPGEHVEKSEIVFRRGMRLPPVRREHVERPARSRSQRAWIAQRGVHSDGMPADPVSLLPRYIRTSAGRRGSNLKSHLLDSRTRSHQLRTRRWPQGVVGPFRSPQVGDVGGHGEHARFAVDLYQFRGSLSSSGPRRSSCGSRAQHFESFLPTRAAGRCLIELLFRLPQFLLDLLARMPKTRAHAHLPVSSDEKIVWFRPTQLPDVLSIVGTLALSSISPCSSGYRKKQRCAPRRCA